MGWLYARRPTSIECNCVTSGGEDTAEKMWENCVSPLRVETICVRLGDFLAPEKLVPNENLGSSWTVYENIKLKETWVGIFDLISMSTREEALSTV